MNLSALGSAPSRSESFARASVISRLGARILPEFRMCAPAFCDPLAKPGWLVCGSLRIRSRYNYRNLYSYYKNTQSVREIESLL